MSKRSTVCFCLWLDIIRLGVWITSLLLTPWSLLADSCNVYLCIRVPGTERCNDVSRLHLRSAHLLHRLACHRPGTVLRRPLDVDQTLRMRRVAVFSPVRFHVSCGAVSLPSAVRASDRDGQLLCSTARYYIVSCR